MNPYLIIGLLIAWLSSLAGVGYWQRQDGITITEAAYAKLTNAALIEVNTKLKSTEESNRRAEQQHATDQAAASSKYQKELQDANKKTADLIAAARTGTFRLHDPARLQTVGSGLSKTPARAGGCDAASDGGLSADAIEFLLDLTGRCNKTRDQLAACQSVVVSDRVQ